MEKTVLPPNPTKVATKWAVINGLVSIILTYVFLFMDIDQSSPLQWIGIIPPITFLFLTQKEFKDELGGFITFGQGFSAGFRYALFTGLIVGVFIALYMWILNPEAFEKSLEASRVQMEAKDMSSAEIEKAMGISRSIGPWIAGFFTAVMYAAVGAIIALIGAAIFKKERSPNDIVDSAVDPE